MALSDPQTITVNGVAKTLNRISQSTDDRKGIVKTVYRTADRAFTLTVSHTTSGDRVRSMARLDQVVAAADPLSAEMREIVLTDYHVVDRPLVGFTTTQVQQQVTGFQTWHTSTVVDKMYGGES